MAGSTDQFLNALAAIGVLSVEEAAALLDALPPDKRPADTQTLARLLVQRGKLTAFQAQAVYQGKAKGLVFGEYIVLDELGAGGMGQVFKAQHRRMKRVVALKVMSPAAMKEPSAVRRFQREVEAAARLSHVNIVTAFDASQQQGVHYLVMEYVEGTDLAALVKKRGPLAVDQATNCILQAARGLAYAHGEGVIHRDIKPANLLLDKSGTVKILDMGLARFEDSNSEALTGTEQVMGTVDYMSPEQASETKSADARSDQYSLGCTLWYLLVGRRMYEGDTAVKRIMQHVGAPVPSLCQTREEIPWALDQIYQRMVAKQPNDRYPSLNEVVAALEDMQAGGSGLSRLAAASDPSLASAFDFTRLDGSTAPATKAAPVRRAASASSAEQQTGALEAQVDTDPKSDLRMPAGARAAATSSGRHDRPAGKKPLLLAAAAAGLLLVVGAVGITMFLPGADRGEVAQTNDGSEAPQAVAAATGTPQSAPAQADQRSSAKAAPDALDTPGPAEDVWVGLVPRPAKLPGIRRWQVETIAPRGGLNSVAWSPDSRFLAVAGAGTVRIFDAETQRLVRIFATPVGASSYRFVEWHPTRPLLAVSGNGLTVYPLDSNNGGYKLVEPAIVVRALAFSPDGTKLACGQKGGALACWSVEAAAGAEPKFTPGPHCDTRRGEVSSLAWKANGQGIIARTSSPSLVWDWSLAAAEPKQLMFKTAASWQFVIAHPQEPQLVGIDAAGEWGLYRLDGKKLLAGKNFVGSDIVRSAAWSPDGKLLAVSFGYLVRLIEPDGQIVAEMPVSASANLKWSADSNRVAGVNFLGGTQVWSSRAIQLMRVDSPGSRITAMSFSEPINQFATVGDDPFVRLWSADGKALKTLPDSLHYSVAWSRDGKQLATRGSNTTGNSFRLWIDPLRSSDPPRLVNTTHEFLCLAWSPDGQRLALGCKDKLVRIFDGQGKEITQYSGLAGGATVVAWNPQGTLLAAVATQEKSLRIWNAAGKVVGSADNLPFKPMALAWQHSGKLLACSGELHTVACYTPEGKQVWKENYGNTLVRSLSWNPDDSQLAIASQNLYVTVCTAAGTSPYEACLHDGEAVQVAWAADGQSLISISIDMTVRCWNLRSHGPDWIAAALADGTSVTFGAGGRVIDGTAKQLQEKFVYAVEADDGRLGMFSFNEFLKFTGLPAEAVLPHNGTK